MSRRERTSVGEDLIRAVAMLPWWACLVIAVASYYTFGWWAAKPLPTYTGAASTSGMINAAITRGWAAALQYIVPIVCSAAAVISGATRWQRSREGEAWPFPPGFASPMHRGTGQPLRPPSTPKGPTSTGLACPDCGSSMVLRKARKGRNAGGSFYGCSTYPQCRGTRPA